MEEVIEQVDVKEAINPMDLVASGKFDNFDDMVNSVTGDSEGEVADNVAESEKEVSDEVEELTTEIEEIEEVEAETKEVIEKPDIEEIKSKLESFNKPTTQVPQQPVQQQRTIEQPLPSPTNLPRMEELPSIPKRVEKPNLPSDPQDFTLEDEKKFNDYIFARDEYDRQMETYLGGIAKGLGGVGEIIGEVEKMRNVEAQRIEAAATKAKAKHYWDSVESFQKKNTAFETEGDIQEVRQQSISFEDEVAKLAGITNKGDMGAYVAQVDLAMQLLEAGDENLVGKVEAAGIVKPESYDNYKNLLDLDRFREEAINGGSLGTSATLEDAYALSRFRDGNFETAISEVEKEATVNAVKDVTRTIKDAQQAVKSPGRVGAKSKIDNGVADGLTTEEARMVEEITRDMSLLSNPDYRKAFEKTLK